MNGVTRWELSQQWIPVKIVVEVKIPPTRGKDGKTPVHLYYSLNTAIGDRYVQDRWGG